MRSARRPSAGRKPRMRQKYEPTRQPDFLYKTHMVLENAKMNFEADEEGN